MTQNDINVSETDGYDRSTEHGIRRRTRFQLNGSVIMTEHRYAADGQIFTVRSFFDKREKNSAEDLILRLMDSHIE